MIRSMRAEDVAYSIIRAFSNSPSLPEELRAKYFEWLTDSAGREAKDKALWRLFQESCAMLGAPAEEDVQKRQKTEGAVKTAPA